MAAETNAKLWLAPMFAVGIVLQPATAADLKVLTAGAYKQALIASSRGSRRRAATSWSSTTTPWARW
jgi:hypothetical protein